MGRPETALRAAGRLLATRARSRTELREALTRKYGPEVVEDVVERLASLGLVDDVAFARSWVEERRGRAGLAPRRAVEELVARGVERHVAEKVVAEGGPDEHEQAAEVAGRLVTRVAGLPRAKQASRLLGMLARRGFEPEAAAAGVRAVLPPDGWD